MLLKMMKNWLVVLYIFMVVYAPPLGPNPPLLKLGMLLGVPIVLFAHQALSRQSGASRLLQTSGSRALIYGVGAGAILVVTTIVLRNKPIDSFADTRFVQNCSAIVVLMNVALIVELLRRRGFTRSQGFEILLWLASLQGVIAILGVMSPAVKDISNGLYLAGGNDNEFVLDSRVYGISGEFTYGTPIYHGVLAGLAVHLMVTRGARYFMHIPLILTAVFLNGRTGLLVFVLVALVAVCTVYLRRGNVLGLVAGVAGLGYALWLGLNLLARFVPGSYEFVSALLTDSRNLIVNDTATGNYVVLTREILLVPEGWGLFFGEGVRLYTGVASVRTDIGFTNDLFAGGLLYWALAYGGLVLFIYSKGVERLVSFELLVASVVANLKGELLHSTVVLFILCFAVLAFAHLGDAPELSDDRSDSRTRGARKLRSGVRRSSSTNAYRQSQGHTAERWAVRRHP